MIVKFENKIRLINHKIFEKEGDYVVLQKLLNEKWEKDNGRVE